MEGLATSDNSTPNFLRQALSRREFVYTAELVLGRDHNAAEAEEFVREASQHAEGIKVISLTDLPGGNPALPPDAFASFVRDRNLTPIAHLSGKDGNRSFLEARLHALARTGIENVLALTGDAQRTGFSGKSKPVHDLDSVLILSLVQALRTGLEYEVGGRSKCTTPFDFFAGAVVNPYKLREPDLLMQLYKLQLKVAVGTQFVITQIGYNVRKLDELKQYMARESMGHIPILASVYVPTARIARMMQSGEIPGCVVTDQLLKRLESEKKAERLERAALMVAAVRDLGFAGAHIGGFGLLYKDYLTIIERANIIGKDWRGRIHELLFSGPGDFYLLTEGGDGLSDANGDYRVNRVQPNPSWVQRLSETVHSHFIRDGSLGAFIVGSHLKGDGQENGSNPRHGFWYRLVAPSTVFRKAAFGCVDCGDCLLDYLNYAGCSMRWCYKELRNGPCGGSRVDGTCEASPDLPCIWNQIYSGTLAMGDDPRKFAHTLIPPRDWTLDRTNALANRFAGLDNFSKRTDLQTLDQKDTKPC
jgi:methylenetetrahydrofolate reductase (NADPH)